MFSERHTIVIFSTRKTKFFFFWLEKLESSIRKEIENGKREREREKGNERQTGSIKREVRETNVRLSSLFLLSIKYMHYEF